MTEKNEIKGIKPLQRVVKSGCRVGRGVACLRGTTFAKYFSEVKEEGGSNLRGGLDYLASLWVGKKNLKCV